jgi:hypothetical protein
VTKESLSSVDIWTRPAESKPRTEALRRSANKPLDEPYAFWERRGKTVFVSDIKGMSLEDLDVLASDMQVKWNELNSEISTEYARLASVPETQPSVADKLRLTIRRMVRKKTHAKTILWEASRQKSYLNKDKHRPKPKLVNSQRDKDSLTALDSKMNYFRIKELMPLIRAEIGDARFDVLESQARAQAIPLFQEWVTTTDAPPVLIEHVLLENQKHMLPTP